METVDLGKRALHRRKDARSRLSELSVRFSYAEGSFMTPSFSFCPPLVLAWDYRRYVLASMPIRRSDKVELAYTTKKIEANFSNFSAWHQRTKVLSSLWESGEVDRTSSLQKGAGCSRPLFFFVHITDLFHPPQPQLEFELVQNAMFTLPEDQSAWLYHRWLIGSGMRAAPSFACVALKVAPGDDKAVLEREINLIQTLLDEQPDSKCEYY